MRFTPGQTFARHKDERGKEQQQEPFHGEMELFHGINNRSEKKKRGVCHVTPAWTRSRQ